MDILQPLKNDPLLLGGTIVFLALAVYIYQGLRNPISHIPGPWYTKFSSWPSTICVITARHPSWVHALHEKYGPVVRISPHEIDITDLAAVKRIHSAKDGYLKDPFYSKLITDSDSVFNTIYPQNHRKYKRLLSAPMSETGLKQFLPQIDAKVRLALQRIRDENKTRGAADLAKWFMFLSFDIVGELTFGESFGNLERGTRNRSVDDFVSLGFVGGLRSMFPSISWLSLYLPIPVFKDATAIQYRTFDYAEKALARHKKLVEDNGGVDPKPTAFSKVYNGEHEETWSPTEVRDNAQVFIVGGSDTTANSMIYLVWAICRDPDIKRQLLKELEGLADDFGYDELRNMPYINCIVDETLRLYNALPAGLPRIVPREGFEVGKHFIPGGATVTTQAYSLHRDEEAFPDPYKFYPDRWLKKNDLMKDSLMPFGGGARTCLGRHLARVELRLICARFFKAFPNATVSTLEGMSEKDMEMALHFLMVPSGHRCLIKLGN